MALWSRVFSGGSTTQQGSGGCCTITSAACNRTSIDQGSTKPDIYDDLPVTVSGIADAVGYWVEQLRRRLAARATITSSNLQLYNIVLRQGSRTSTVTWQLENLQGAFPLVVGYTTPADSESNVQFQNINHALDWLVERLA